MPELLIPNISALKSYSQMELPDPDDLEYYIGRTNRLFYVEDTIYRDDSGYSDIAQLIKAIININVEDVGKPVKERKPIIVVIDSPGGDLDLSFAFADVIRTSNTPVYTFGLSSVMSGAFIVFLGGKKRFLLPHSQILTHQGSISIEGGASEAQSMMANYKKVLSRMKNYILENTGIDEKTFNSHKKGDWYISADEAVNKYGIADKIITNIEEVFNN